MSADVHFPAQKEVKTEKKVVHFSAQRKRSEDQKK